MKDELIVVDGYNVIFRIPELRAEAEADLMRARDELVRRLSEAFRGRQERVTVVFDGHRDAGQGTAAGGRGNVRVIFSVPPATADDTIQRLIEGFKPSAGRRPLLRVVSSDREVAERGQLWGANVSSAEGFMREVDERRKPQVRGRDRTPRPPSGREIEEWERLFRERPRRDDEDDDSRP
jgi:predicted RNA-binding protein with PIN domain